MLNKQEQDFFNYWDSERIRKKKFLRKFSFGLPFGVLVAAAILINLMSGWYKKADMEVRSQGSLVLVVIVAVLGIVVFITVFSAHHKWDQNEQHYQELLKKQDQKI